MTPPTPPPEENGFSDSDQQWFDRLSGKVAAVTDAAAIREADALRRAIALERAETESDPRLAAADSPGEQERQWQALQFRLRREDLADQRPTTRRRWLSAGAAIAASIVAAVLIVPRLSQDDGTYYDEPPTMRGEPQVIRRTDPQPRKAAETLATDLRAGGLKLGLYQQKKTYVIDIDVAPDAPEAALAALRKAGLEAKPGLQRILIAPK